MSLRNYRGASGTHPFVSVSMVPMPMGVHDVFQRRRADLAKSPLQLILRGLDAGIEPSQDKLQGALGKIGPSPLKYVVNTHWHWDHTDGNEWMRAAGATIVAQRH